MFLITTAVLALALLLTLLFFTQLKTHHKSDTATADSASSRSSTKPRPLIEATSLLNDEFDDPESW